MAENTPNQINRHSCEGRSPSQQRSLGLDVGAIRHSLRSYGSLPAQGCQNKIMTLGFLSLLRRQGSIPATKFGLRRWRHKAFAALKWIPSCEGMTKCPKHKRSVTPAKPDSAPAKAGGPSQQRSLGLNVGAISIRYAHMDPCLCRDGGKYTKPNQSSLLRRQESIPATKFGLRRWGNKAFATLTWIPACAGMT
jgi:hypothetical protein